MKFWEASALLSLLLEQARSAELKSLLASDGHMALWWGTKVEAVSAVCRLRRLEEIDQEGASHSLGHVDDASSRALEIQPAEEVRSIACRMLRVHELRPADAFHLSAALVWAEHRPSGMGFVCLDRRLREAAQREGFDLYPR